MLVSIIIALYNTEKYIEKCIQSVLDCSLPSVDYEIIVINDGSTDNSKTIVEKLIKANPNTNFQLINKENGGQSSARNLGFEVARGQFIFCLDSDDYIDGTGFIQALNLAIINDLDMLPYLFIKVDENGNQFPFKDTYKALDKPISGIEFLNRFVISGAMARYFYKTSIIKENNLKLIDGIYQEDEEFVIRFLTYVKKIIYKPIPLYFYLTRSNSTLNNKNVNHSIKLINDLIVVVDSLSDLIDKNSNNLLMISGIDKKRQQLVLSIIIKLYRSNINRLNRNTIIKLLKDKRYIPLKSSRLNYKQKLVSRVINCFLKLQF